ncbi:hypothetical protein ANN_23363 [Periplaneta americana]|uniref:DUF4817 domain-containing protein n=1 Tax=Periplaneta americana TaxID=6978 RepID=A0ABQ8SM66_PERAM|nr:hypothetical protein ANN_23363 [Periplaneta americana]
MNEEKNDKRINWSLREKRTRKKDEVNSEAKGTLSVVFGAVLCDMYSYQKLAEVHFMYGKADDNAVLSRRFYQESYPDHWIAHLNAIDLAWDRTRNLGHRRPALYQLANQVDLIVKREGPGSNPGWDKLAG